MTSQDDARLESERSALQERIEDMQNSAFKVFDTHSYFESIVSKASHELEKHVNSLRNTAAKTLQLKDGGQKLKNLLSFAEDLLPVRKEIERIEAKLKRSKVSRVVAVGSAFDFDLEEPQATEGAQQRQLARRDTETAWNRYETKPPLKPKGFTSLAKDVPGMPSSRRKNPIPQRGRAMMMDQIAKQQGVQRPKSLPRKDPLPLSRTEQPKSNRTVLETRDAAKPIEIASSPTPPSPDAGAPAPRASARKAARKTDLIEILSDSDNEGADRGAGQRGGDSDKVVRSTRPTRSTVKLSIPQRIGDVSAIYPSTQQRGAGPGTSNGGTVLISSRDLLTLDDGEFLNDTVIDFFIKQQQKDQPDREKSRCHIFNSFFYEKLTNVRDERGKPADVLQRAAHDRVKKWTRDVNIFEKDFVFFPIHQHLHWSLVILCHPSRVPMANFLNIDDDDDAEEDLPLGELPHACLLHLDSMSGGHRTTQVCVRLREYLAMEYLRWKPEAQVGEPQSGEANLLGFTKTGLESRRMKVPQQDNGCDCGLFVLSFIERFLVSLPKRLSKTDIESAHKGTLPESGSLTPGFLRSNWFVPEEAALQRSQISREILFVLLQNMPDPEVESANGASKETIQKLTTRRENLQVVLQELSVRIHERQMATTEAEISLKRKLERAEENRRRRSAERASAEQASVDRNEVKIFTGKSHTLREERLKDRDGAADAATFYGTGGVTSGAKSRHQKTEVDLTLQDSEAARGDEEKSFWWSERQDTGKRITDKPSSTVPTRRRAGKRFIVESDSESAPAIALPKDTPTSSPVKIASHAPEPVEITNATVSGELLASESESESEEVRATASLPLEVRRGLRTAAQAAQVKDSAADLALRDVVNKRKRRSGEVDEPPPVRPTRAAVAKYGAFYDDAVDLTAGKEKRSPSNDSIDGDGRDEDDELLKQMRGVVPPQTLSG